MPNAILSPTLGKPDEIKALTDRVNELTTSFDIWNKWMLWGLGFAALAAVWIGLTTRMTIVRSKQLTAAQGNLEATKEAALKTELAGKDQKIAEVNKAAGLANERAAEIQASVAPRRFSPSESLEFESVLKPFAGEILAIWYITGDAEGYALAWDIAALAHNAGLNVAAPASITHMGGSGTPYDSALAVAKNGITVASTTDASSLAAAKKIIEKFNSLGFTCAAEPPVTDREGKAVWINIQTRPQGPQGRFLLDAARHRRP